MAVALATGTMRSVPVGGRIASSVHNFRKNLGELRKVETMNPVERIIFSLALANYTPKA